VCEARARWAQAIAGVAHHRFLFIDESGAKTNLTRLYGRAPRGQRVYDEVPCGRWETTTLISAVGRHGAQAPFVFDGPIDGAMFAAWAQHILAPTLQPGDIVVMDNLSVHKNAAARSAIEAAGAQIWYLPPYSPDLNPIEKMWSKVKALLRDARARDPDALFEAIGHALSKITHQDIAHWFVSCGYSLI
jgi:transposase